MLRALRHRDFRLLWIGQAVSLLGDGIYLVAIAWLVYDLSNAPGALPTPDLHDYANYVVKPELERVPGAGRIEVLASDTREIEVVLDPSRLAAADLSVEDVAGALKAQNQLLPAGRFAQAGQQLLSLASGLWTSADQIAAAPVAATKGGVVRVSDIGTVTQGSPDRTMLITGNGRDAVSISISQQIDANILSVKEGVDAVLGTLTRSLPSGIPIKLSPRVTL